MDALGIAQGESGGPLTQCGNRGLSVRSIRLKFAHGLLAHRFLRAVSQVN
jgi:hypothetical protein